MGNRGQPEQTSMRGETLGPLKAHCLRVPLPGQGSWSEWVSEQGEGDGIEVFQRGNEQRGHLKRK